MSVEFYRESPGKFDSRISRETLSRWTWRNYNYCESDPGLAIYVFIHCLNALCALLHYKFPFIFICGLGVKGPARWDSAHAAKRLARLLNACNMLTYGHRHSQTLSFWALAHGSLK